MLFSEIIWIIITILASSLITLFIFLFIKFIVWFFKKQSYSKKLNIKIITGAIVINIFWFIMYWIIWSFPNINFTFTYSLLFFFPALSIWIVYYYFLAKEYWKENSIYVFIALLVWNFLAILWLIAWAFRNWM